MHSVQKHPFCRKCSDSYYTLHNFAEVGEDRGFRGGLHSSEVSTSAQIPNCEFTVGKTNDKCWNKKSRKDRTKIALLALFLARREANAATPTKQ